MGRRSPDGPPAHTEVAPGVYRFGSARVNWYLVEDGGDLTLVDAGLPGHWRQLLAGLGDLGYGLDDVGALVLTHGHPDHVGFAARLREEAGVPVMVHEADAATVRGEAAGTPVGEVVRNLWRPAVLGLLVELARGGGTSIPPVETVEPFEDGDVLDVAGTPRVIHVPGHSEGSSALYLPDREVLLCGDALATLDIQTGRTGGPQLMPMFNADGGEATASLDRLADLGPVTLLPGHGDPWRGEAAEAVRHARGR